MLFPSILQLLLVQLAWANVEKAVFLGPETVNIPSTHPTIEDLKLDTLTPDQGSIRTHIESLFSNASHPLGKTTWLILDELTPGQRYEVRVCWAATQPTRFEVNTFEVPVVFEKPELIADVSEFSWARQSNEAAPQANNLKARDGRATEREASILFLQILAAADYYTTNQTLMSEVPPVYVDIILDPFILNILPRSLAPTVCYIVIVAVASWFLAQRISLWVRQIATPSQQKKRD